MEVVNKEYDFESLKEDIEKIKYEYIHNKFEREKVKSDYIRKRDNLICYTNLFDDLSKKEIIQNVLKSSDKNELEFNKKILKEYKKIMNDNFFVEKVNDSEDIRELLKKDYEDIKSVMFYKISCTIVPILQIAITLFSNYGILFFPYENIIRYLFIIIELYFPSLFFDYLKEHLKEDIGKLRDLKYTLKEENKRL